jgi:anti-anti-sigma factor
MKLNLLGADNEVTRVLCEGNISQDSIRPGNDPIETLLGPDCYGRKVLLDLERAQYIDSSGVSWLMGRHKAFAQAGGRLVLYSIPPMVSQVLHLLRMSMVLDMANDEAAARSLALGGSKS